MMNSERIYQYVIGVLVALVVIQGWWIIVHSAGTAPSQSSLAASTSTAPTMTQPATGTTTAPQGAMNASSVSVANQPAGMSVAVASVTLAADGWVAIRDSSGRTLGAAFFPAGTHANVSVPLLRGTVSGQHYQALIYKDNGDKQFDLHTDTLVTNVDGTVAGSAFSTTQ